MAGLDDDYDDQKLRNERKLAEYYKIRRDCEIKQAETDELHNIIEEEMSELDEMQRKFDAKNKKHTFWGNFWKAVNQVKEKIIDTTSEYLDFSGHNYDEDSESTENVEKKENETTKEPESEIINVTERLSNIGNDNLKQREELFNNESESSKTDPSAQNENDDQQLFDSKMLELDQITTNNNIRKAVVEENFNFIRKQRAEYFERFKKLDNENKQTVWGNVCKVAKGIKGHVIETTSEYLDFSAGGGVYVENRKNGTTKQPESEIRNVTEKVSKTENDNVMDQEKLLRKTETIENEIFYKQGTSKQINVEVNNSKHEENVPIIDQGIPGTVGDILINQNFTGLNLKDKLDKADKLLTSAREADKKIKKEEEYIKQNQEILNNIGATIEKMEQEKNKPGLSNKIIDGARTLTNYVIDTAKPIIDVAKTCTNYVIDTVKPYYTRIKAFGRATLSMGMKQRTQHRGPKEGDPNGPSNAEPKHDEKTKSNDIPKNTAQSGNNNDDQHNSPNYSNGFAKAVIGTGIAGAAVGAFVGSVVGGPPGALVGAAVGAATGAVVGTVVYAGKIVVKTCESIEKCINEVKKAASSLKEGVKSAWNRFKGWFS